MDQAPPKSRLAVEGGMFWATHQDPRNRRLHTLTTSVNMLCLCALISGLARMGLSSIGVLLPDAFVVDPGFLVAVGLAIYFCQLDAVGSLMTAMWLLVLAQAWWRNAALFGLSNWWLWLVFSVSSWLELRGHAWFEPVDWRNRKSKIPIFGPVVRVAYVLLFAPYFFVTFLLIESLAPRKAAVGQLDSIARSRVAAGDTYVFGSHVEAGSAPTGDGGNDGVDGTKRE